MDLHTGLTQFGASMDLHTGLTQSAVGEHLLSASRPLPSEESIMGAIDGLMAETSAPGVGLGGPEPTRKRAASFSGRFPPQKIGKLSGEQGTSPLQAAASPAE